MATTGREFFTVKTVSEALTGFRPGHVTPVETVPLGLAYGRVPDTEIVAGEALPGFDRSSVDGYAVRAADTFGASESIPGYLRVVGAVRMGGAAGHRRRGPPRRSGRDRRQVRRTRRRGSRARAARSPAAGAGCGATRRG